MVRGKLFKHENCTDVAFWCMWIMYIHAKDGYKAKGMWWNTVGKAPWPMGVTDKIFIKRQDLSKWKVVDLDHGSN